MKRLSIILASGLILHVSTTKTISWDKIARTGFYATVTTYSCAQTYSLIKMLLCTKTPDLAHGLVNLTIPISCCSTLYFAKKLYDTIKTEE